MRRFSCGFMKNRAQSVALTYAFLRPAQYQQCYCASVHTPPPTPAPEFEAKDTASYWANRWDKGLTAWKAAEVQKPFANNMTKVLEAAGKPTTNLKEALTGKTVFVPLCGDTYAARFFADHGCNVVGIDIAEAAVLAAQEQYFTAEEGFEVTKQEVLDGAVVQYTITKTDGSAGSVRYYVGDIFAVVDKIFNNTVFDVVYDRASLMAMHPSLRQQYLTMMRSVFKSVANENSWKPVMFVDFAIRPTHLRAQGPPFYIQEPIDVLYPAEDGYRHQMIQECELDFIEALEKGGDVPEGRLPFSLRNFAVWTA